jgi:hypothetical protein
MNKILLEIDVFLLFLAIYVTLKFAHRMEGKRKENKGGAKKTIVPSPLKHASTPKHMAARIQGEVRSLKMAKNTKVKNILVQCKRQTRVCTFGNDVLFRS